MKKSEYNVIDINILRRDEIKPLFESLLIDVQQKTSNFVEWLCHNFIGPFVVKIFQFGKYAEVCILAEILGEDRILLSDIIFYVAYSYGENKQSSSAEYYYNLYLSIKGESAAVLNNLGVIYENRGDLKGAMDLFDKSKRLDINDEKAKNNYLRVKGLIHDKDSEEDEERRAVDMFKNENAYIQNKFLNFCNRRGSDGLIVCSYRLLPNFLNISAQKAPDIIRDWLEKKYLKKTGSQDPNVKSNVYEINPHILGFVGDLKENLKKEEQLLEICNGMNNSTLETLGYNKVLEDELSKKISNEDLRNMLKRDLWENVISLVANSYKSSLVLSGSIIEAVLLFRLSENGIKIAEVLKGKKKIKMKVEELDLYELVSVAKNNKLIDDNLLHLSHGVRGFRNLIHPGVEQRKKSMKVNEDNALLAWAIVKKVIFDVN